MMVFAIDPGTFESAYFIYDPSKAEPFLEFGKVTNEDLLDFIRNLEPDLVMIEMIASYGMAVGQEVFETCVWIGRFEEAAKQGGASVERIKRKTIAAHHCGNAKANDSNVRTALVERFGEPGTKKHPGPTIGITKDIWSAMALAVWKADQIDPSQGLKRRQA